MFAILKRKGDAKLPIIVDEVIFTDLTIAVRAFYFDRVITLDNCGVRAKKRPFRIVKLVQTI